MDIISYSVHVGYRFHMLEDMPECKPYKESKEVEDHLTIFRSTTKCSEFDYR